MVYCVCASLCYIAARLNTHEATHMLQFLLITAACVGAITLGAIVVIAMTIEVIAERRRKKGGSPWSA